MAFWVLHGWSSSCRLLAESKTLPLTLPPLPGPSETWEPVENRRSAVWHCSHGWKITEIAWHSCKEISECHLFTLLPFHPLSLFSASLILLNSLRQGHHFSPFIFLPVLIYKVLCMLMIAWMLEPIMSVIWTSGGTHIQVSCSVWHLGKPALCSTVVLKNEVCEWVLGSQFETSCLWLRWCSKTRCLVKIPRPVFLKWQPSKNSFPGPKVDGIDLF